MMYLGGGRLYQRNNRRPILLLLYCWPTGGLAFLPLRSFTFLAMISHTCTAECTIQYIIYKNLLNYSIEHYVTKRVY